MALVNFSDEDLEALHDVIEARKLERRRPRYRDVKPVSEGGGVQACYIALTPNTGIVGLVEPMSGSGVGTGTADEEEYDKPGSAMCNLYKIVKDEVFGGYKIVKAAKSAIRVFNLNHADVPPLQFVTVHKDVYGSWIVASQGIVFAVCDDVGTHF